MRDVYAGGKKERRNNRHIQRVSTLPKRGEAWLQVKNLKRMFLDVLFRNFDWVAYLSNAIRNKLSFVPLWIQIGVSKELNKITPFRAKRTRADGCPG